MKKVLRFVLLVTAASTAPTLLYAGAAHAASRSGCAKYDQYTKDQQNIDRKKAFWDLGQD